MITTWADIRENNISNWNFMCKTICTRFFFLKKFGSDNTQHNLPGFSPCDSSLFHYWLGEDGDCPGPLKAPGSLCVRFLISYLYGDQTITCGTWGVVWGQVSVTALVRPPQQENLMEVNGSKRCFWKWLIPLLTEAASLKDTDTKKIKYQVKTNVKSKRSDVHFCCQQLAWSHY